MKKINMKIAVPLTWTAIAFLLFGLPLISALISAHFESEAYNRLTGAHTTTWDALWLDLRVQDSPK